ncbi:MAG: DUF4097 family beta strand repeat-containing protein [Gemmatimonas sp.]
MGRRSFSVQFALVVAAALAMLPATGAAQRRSDTTFALARNALVDVTVRSGYVVVRGSDRDEGELNTNGAGYTIKPTAGGVVVGIARNTNLRRLGSGDTDEPRLELTVPRGARVVINAGRADVEVRGLDGDVEVHSSSGDIRMSRLGGRAIVETLSGDLLISEGVGDLRVTSSSGDVIAYGLRGAATVHTTSGDVSLSGTAIPQVLIESISGDASFDGSLAQNGRFQMTTHSGDVVLRLADGARGALEFFTHSGEMTTSIPLTMSGGLPGFTNSERRPGQRFVFGGGGPAMISISTFNGDVRVERGSSRSTDR